MIDRWYHWLLSIDWTPEAVTAAATAILAFLTLILGASTLGMWLSTRRLVKDGRDTAKRQLRAYPGVVGATIGIHSGKVHVAVEIANTSTTTAYKFRHALCHEFYKPGTVRRFTKADFNHMQWDMAPHSKTTMRSVGDIGEKQIDAVILNDLGVVFWGRAEYEDAFGDLKWTPWCGPLEAIS
jgi:hypothetical protein